MSKSRASGPLAQISVFKLVRSAAAFPQQLRPLVLLKRRSEDARDDFIHPTEKWDQKKTTTGFCFAGFVRLPRFIVVISFTSSALFVMYTQLSPVLRSSPFLSSLHTSHPPFTFTFTFITHSSSSPSYQHSCAFLLTPISSSRSQREELRPDSVLTSAFIFYSLSFKDINNKKNTNIIHRGECFWCSRAARL